MRHASVNRRERINTQACHAVRRRAFIRFGARRPNGGQTTLYPTAPVFGMSHVLMELAPDLTVKTSYVYGGHQQLIEEPVAADRTKDLYLLHDGTVGNITHATTRTAATVNSYSYEAFGTRTPQTPATAGRYGYTGEEYDTETGLIYLRARYYDPALGRFISPDPFLGRLAEPITQNRYVYVKNNPLGFTDPSGLAAAQRWETRPHPLNVNDPFAPTAQNFLQALLPASTAYFSKNPIGGTPTAQLQYAIAVNTLRDKVSDAAWMGSPAGPVYIAYPLKTVLKTSAEWIASSEDSQLFGATSAPLLSVGRPLFGIPNNQQGVGQVRPIR